ncbi:MAG: NAD(P)/FAD-dependent oxidoreductase [Verrucomicrobiales bacterium]|jgi:predicted Rossmann fold flavoprotein|nr:NAD(P)/FAD-dependent oxidoreductase [Verrucomicrobiales bacterium]
MYQPKHIIIVGGGAAGFFAALMAKAANPALTVTIVEAAGQMLRKVSVSGGGRCNVTHACFDPRELVKFYPRGNKELLGAFHKFQPRDTLDWFAARGVPLKTEADGRVFPVSDSARSIVDCLTHEARRLNVSVRVNAAVNAVKKMADGRFALTFAGGDRLAADHLLLACGGTCNISGARLAAALGHSLSAPVPSLFSFRVNDERLGNLSGVTVPNVTVSAGGLRQSGPLLITHEGLSGPAILRLSAWGARWFAGENYRFTVSVDWTGGQNIGEQFTANRRHAGKRQLRNDPPFAIPRRLWERLLATAEIPADRHWHDLRKSGEETLTRALTMTQFQVTGKSVNKEEFVTCGGIPLREVDFRAMTSKLCPGLYFAGEILDLDALTGGFNLQAAWTTGWLAGQSMAR